MRSTSLFPRGSKQTIIVGMALVALSMAAFHGSAEAQSLPTFVNYQGRLTSPIGAPVADASYTVVFRLYAAPTGGSPLWSETDSVTTRNGVFSVGLGKAAAFQPALFTRPLFLEIEANGKVLAPRQELGMVPFSVSAQTLPDGTVGTSMIANVAVTTAKLADKAVSNGKIGDSAIDSRTLADGAVTGAKLAAGSVGAAQLAASQDSLAKVSGNALTASNGNLSVTGDIANYNQLGKLNVADSFEARVRCADFIMGFPDRRGTPGRAIVDMGSYIAYNFSHDWPRVEIQSDTSILGNLSKAGGSFKIDHPLDPTHKYLEHSFVESPDMKNVYDGIAVLDEKGEATVSMPAWFEKLNRDFRYQLTCVGGYASVFIQKEVKGGSFQIGGGTPGLKVSWQVTGIRQDPWANAHRIQVEESKPPAYQGSYLHPAEYGKPERLSETNAALASVNAARSR